MRSSVKVKLRLPKQWNHTLTCGIWVTSSSRGIIGPDYPPKAAARCIREGKLPSTSPSAVKSWLRTSTLPHTGWKAPDLQLLLRREGAVSANWRDTRAGVIIFAKKGTRVSWQKAEGCPDLCVHFQKHLTLDQILSAVLKLGRWMGNAYWTGWLGAPTEGAGAQPGASLQLASWAFSHGQRECVIILILTGLSRSCLSIYFEVSACWNFWFKWGTSGDDAEPLTWLKEGEKVAQQGSRFLLQLHRQAHNQTGARRYHFIQPWTYLPLINSCCCDGSSDPCLLIKHKHSGSRKTSHRSPSWTSSRLGQVY